MPETEPLDTTAIRARMAEAEDSPEAVLWLCGIARTHVPALCDALDEARQEVEEVVVARNYAMRQRDAERGAKEGNIRALNAAIIRAEAAEAERDRLAAQVERVRALAFQFHREGATYRGDRVLRALDAPAEEGP